MKYVGSLSPSKSKNSRVVELAALKISLQSWSLNSLDSKIELKSRARNSSFLFKRAKYSSSNKKDFISSLLNDFVEKMLPESFYLQKELRSKIRVYAYKLYNWTYRRPLKLINKIK